MLIMRSGAPGFSHVSTDVFPVLHFHQSVPFLPLFLISSQVKMESFTLPTLYFIHFPNTVLYYATEQCNSRAEHSLRWISHSVS